MTIRIMPNKVQAKNIARSQEELNQGYRLQTIKSEGIDRENLDSMILRLRKLAHAKEPSAGTVNQINRESARMTSKKLSSAIEKIDIEMVTNNALAENPLLSTVSAASNVLKFKRASA